MTPPRPATPTPPRQRTSRRDRWKEVRRERHPRPLRRPRHRERRRPWPGGWDRIEASLADFVHPDWSPGFDPDAAEFAADPFGVAELLTSLPAEEAMPDDVVARVSAALAAERLAASAPLERSAVAQADGPAPVVPLQQHRRSAWPKVLGWGVAAAAAVVLGSAVLPSLLSGGGASSTSAALPRGSSATMAQRLLRCRMRKPR